MNSTYSVVHFLDENSVEAVPSIWMKNNGTCAWPNNHSTVFKYIEKNVFQMMMHLLILKLES